MCASAFSKRKPDESFEKEFEAAKQLTNVYLFDVMDLNSIRLPEFRSGRLIYHGWMMPLAYYEKFYNKCKDYGYSLINTSEQYTACHYFNGWYSALENLTPQSTIIEIQDLRPMVDQVRKFMFDNNCSVIIKDYVKSLKHMWNEACFIPKDANALHVAKVIETFLSVKEESKDLQGNLVVRKFVDFKQIGNHDKSGMPLSAEFRTFVIDGELLPTYKYWDQGSYSGDVPTSSFVEEIANKIRTKTGSNLFTIDVAQLKDNTWTCVEVGDGQVSSIPEHEDRLKFFTKLLGIK